MWVLCMQMRTSRCRFSFCGGWKFGLVCVKRNWSPRRYFPISDLGSSHFKFDLAGLCKPGRLFQSPWKLNLSLKPNLSIPFPAVFWHSCVRTEISLPRLGSRGVPIAVPGSSPLCPAGCLHTSQSRWNLGEIECQEACALLCCCLSLGALPWVVVFLPYLCQAHPRGLPGHGRVSRWYFTACTWTTDSLFPPQLGIS